MARATAPNPFTDVTYVRCRLTKAESQQVTVRAAERGLTREAWFRKAVISKLNDSLIEELSQDSEVKP